MTKHSDEWPAGYRESAKPPSDPKWVVALAWSTLSAHKADSVVLAAPDKLRALQLAMKKLDVRLADVWFIAVHGVEDLEP